MRLMTEVHHFAYGWINPVFAFVVSFLGALLSLVFSARSREVTGAARMRWLSLAAVAIGAAGIWVMHLLALMGFDVPASAVRYDLWRTVLSLAVILVTAAGGLYIAGMGEPTAPKTVLGGIITGLGITVMHYTGMASLHTGGEVFYNPNRVLASVVVAVVAATVLLWFSVTIRGASGTVVAALVVGAAACGVHYTAMSAVSVKLDEVTTPVEGVSPAALIAPIFIVAAVVISTLAYITVGISIRRETVRAEAQLAKRRWPHVFVGRIRTADARR
jgi:NO-binding membrane sensor protein with MHYT domain